MFKAYSSITIVTYLVLYFPDLIDAPPINAQNNQVSYPSQPITNGPIRKDCSYYLLFHRLVIRWTMLQLLTVVVF
jgi:hypothetical protein